MPLNRLGDSNKVVSKIGLGLAALGRPSYLTLGHSEDIRGHYEVYQLEKLCHSVLDEAWASGIMYVDAARSYGLAEQFVSTWIKSRGIDHNSMTISSKWGYTYTGNWQIQAPHHEVKMHTMELFERQWPETKALLGQSLDIYQLHSATLDTGVLDNLEIMNAIAKLKDQGVLVGVSVSGTDQRVAIEKALDITIDGIRLFDSIQATYNILEQDCEEALKAAHHTGVGVIVKESMANGRLTNRNQQPLFAPTLKGLQTIAKENHTTVDALALGFVANQPWVDTVLSGVANVKHLRSNLQALNMPMNNALLERLGNFRQASKEYWQIRKHLPWN